MCGIAGFCTTEMNINMKELMNGMLKEIHHRGPDDEGKSLYASMNNGKIVLGHKRLSIIDLSPNGKQPMEAVSGRSSIVFNGEIYNYKELRSQLEENGYKFRTHTDTEVILNMYEEHGEKCLNYFNGMFAFALYDKGEDKLFVARDRLGVKPLYYYSDKGVFAFASEVKALLTLPFIEGTPNYNTLYQYVQHRYVKNPDTLFQGIKKLEAGHFIIVKNFKCDINKYWDIMQFGNISNLNIDEGVERLDEELDRAVRLRMISDVPFGAFLSGGLDSSLITAYMAKNSKQPIKTFSVGFKDEKYSELPYAKQISQLYNTEHHELIIDHRDIINNIYTAVLYRDAPVSEASDIPILLLSKEAKKSVSVIITGEGSDEIFGGYPKYAYDNFSESRIFRTLFDNGTTEKFVNLLPFKYRKLKLAYNTLRDREDIIRHDNWFAAIRSDSLSHLFSEDFKDVFQNIQMHNIKIKGHTNLDRMMYRDIKYWLGDNLLERGDKMLMSASVEGRLPFLDYKLVELAFSMKDNMKIKNLSGKYVVKKLAEKYIPKNNIYRKKVGFYIPVGSWFKNELKDMVSEHLLSTRFRQRGIFNNNELEKMVQEHFRSIYNHEKEIWMLLNLEIWFRTFIDK